MNRSLTVSRGAWIWAGLALAAAAVIWAAPDERTLGAGIKWVYAHAALIWTAMVGLAATGALGAAEGVTRRPGAIRWGRAAGWVTLTALLAAGFTSLGAQLANWGGLYWDEPRMRALLSVTAAWVILQSAGQWLPSGRWRGWLTAAVAAAALVLLRFSPLAIHPQDPIGGSPSAGIRLTFAALFGVTLAAAALATWRLRARFDRQAGKYGKPL